MPKEISGNGNEDKGRLADSAPGNHKPRPTGTVTPDADLLRKLTSKVAKVRSHVQERFGKIALAMMQLPRYRDQTIADLQHILLEPLVRDRITLVPLNGLGSGDLSDMTGVAIWASVSGHVDRTIREQIHTETFPLQLKADDWTSGDIVWVLDVIAPHADAVAEVLAKLQKVAKSDELQLHPLIKGMLND